TTWLVVLGKFFAAWGFATLAIALTFPIWITVDYLGDPEHSVIASSYFGSWLMAGALLALSSCISALTKSQVIAFVIAVVIGILLFLAGQDLVVDALSSWAPDYVIRLVASFSFATHFSGMTSGLIELTAVIYFVTLIALLLLINRQIVELKKAG
ncbi:MAG: ABC transporter permease, partial [Alphaproteobacteria bacterium]